MSKLQKAEQAKTTYQGSAQSAKFLPGTAKSDAKRLSGKKAKIEADNKARQLELDRQQQADSIELQARHKAQTSELNVLNTVTRNNLSRKLQNEKNDLALSNLHSKSKLALKGLHLQSQGNLDVAGLQAQQQVESNRTKLFGDIAQLSLSFAGDVLEYKQAQAKIDAQTAEWDSIFGGDNSAASTTATEVNNFEKTDVITSEKAILAATDDPNIQSTLRVPAQEATQAKQVRRITAAQAVLEMPGQLNDYLNRSDITLVDSRGKPFTPLTAQTHEQINLAVSAGMHRFGAERNLSEMDSYQKINTLLPAARAYMQQKISSLSAVVSRNRGEAAVLNANDTAKIDLASNANAGEVYQELTGSLFASGSDQYRGSLGKAADEAAAIIIKYAIDNPEQAEQILSEFEQTAKVTSQDGSPNSGLLLGRVYETQIKAARREIRSNSITRANLHKSEQVFEISNILETRLGQMATAKNNDEERAINQAAITSLNKLGRQGKTEALKLLNSGLNYNPHAYHQLREEQAMGATLSNQLLLDLRTKGDLSFDESSKLGFNSEGSFSKDEIAKDTLEEFGFKDSNFLKAARGIMMSPINKKDLDSTSKTDLLDNGAAGITKDIAEEMQQELYNWIRFIKPDATQKEINLEFSELTQRYRDRIEGSITIDAETLQISGYFNADGDKPLRTTVGYLNTTDRGPVRDYSRSSIQVLEEQSHDVEISNHRVLSHAELMAGQAARVDGTKIPKSIETKAAILGTNAETLIRMQGKAYGFNIIEEFVPSSLTDTNDNTLIDRLMEATIGHESSGNPGAVNKQTGIPGVHALGLGQVLSSNLKEWSIQALGYEVTRRNFLSNPDIQKKIIRHRMNRNYQDQIAAGYSGVEAIRRTASIWYSGDGDLYNNTTEQIQDGVKYVSIDEYTKDIINRMNDL